MYHISTVNEPRDLIMHYIANTIATEQELEAFFANGGIAKRYDTHGRLVETNRGNGWVPAPVEAEPSPDADNTLQGFDQGAIMFR